MNGERAIWKWKKKSNNDFTSILKTIDVPTLVFAGNSSIFPRSKEQGTWEAQEVQNGKEITFGKGGHMLFYVEAKKFNQAIIDHFYNK
ncbi:alpha/beta fold hydrolase [Limosilactobacillus caccae]|uniref:alpha/beta fold hydrolase n=1 Tax=Limosilactobacillus caccae TaxID=1926284 RepID=UPI000970E017|nr:alpha/beta hydrolase [Limosilactobacillus caccae]